MAKAAGRAGLGRWLCGGGDKAAQDTGSLWEPGTSHAKGWGSSARCARSKSTQLDASQINYPAESLEADNKPCMSAKAKEHSLLGLIAEVSGVTECVFAVQKVLALRAVAWALVSFCHLGAAKTFMALYHRPGLASLALRAPSIQEAEAADAEVCRQEKGYSLDEAIHEAVVVRDSLQLWLQPRPRRQVPDKGPRPEPHERREGKGKGKAGKGKASGTCKWASAHWRTTNSCTLANFVAPPGTGESSLLPWARDSASPAALLLQLY